MYSRLRGSISADGAQSRDLYAYTHIPSTNREPASKFIFAELARDPYLGIRQDGELKYCTQMLTYMIYLCPYDRSTPS